MNAKDYEELTNRLRQASSNELQRILSAPEGEYREEATLAAKEILAKRSYYSPVSEDLTGQHSATEPTPKKSLRQALRERSDATQQIRNNLPRRPVLLSVVCYGILVLHIGLFSMVMFLLIVGQISLQGNGLASTFFISFLCIFSSASAIAMLMRQELGRMLYILTTLISFVASIGIGSRPPEYYIIPLVVQFFVFWVLFRSRSSEYFNGKSYKELDAVSKRANHPPHVVEEIIKDKAKHDLQITEDQINSSIINDLHIPRGALYDFIDDLEVHGFYIAPMDRDKIDSVADMVRIVLDSQRTTAEQVVPPNGP